MKNPPTKTALKSPKIKNAKPNAKQFAFISAFVLYTDAPAKSVILKMTAIPMSIKLHNSMKHTKMYFPFTTSRFAIGSKAENNISFVSLAFWKL